MCEPHDWGVDSYGRIDILWIFSIPNLLFCINSILAGNLPLARLLHPLGRRYNSGGETHPNQTPTAITGQQTDRQKTKSGFSRRFFISLASWVNYGYFHGNYSANKKLVFPFCCFNILFSSSFLPPIVLSAPHRNKQRSKCSECFFKLTSVMALCAGSREQRVS